MFGERATGSTETASSPPGRRLRATTSTTMGEEAPTNESSEYLGAPDVRSERCSASSAPCSSPTASTRCSPRARSTRISRSAAGGSRRCRPTASTWSATSVGCSWRPRSSSSPPPGSSDGGWSDPPRLVPRFRGAAHDLPLVQPRAVHTGDAIANAFASLFTVVAPIALLFAMRRRPAEARGAAATPAGERASRGVPTTRAIRSSGWLTQSSPARGRGARPATDLRPPPDPARRLQRPRVGDERATTVSPRLKHLAELRAAMLSGCEWCLDYGSAISTAAEVERGGPGALPGYGSSDRFDDDDRLVLDYATAMIRTPVDVPDQAVRAAAGALRRGPAGRADQHDRARELPRPLQLGLRAPGQGFSEGAYCVRPERVGAGRGSGLAPAASKGFRREILRGRCRTTT